MNRAHRTGSPGKKPDAHLEGEHGDRNNNHQYHGERLNQVAEQVNEKEGHCPFSGGWEKENGNLSQKGNKGEVASRTKKKALQAHEGGIPESLAKKIQRGAR